MRPAPSQRSHPECYLGVDLPLALKQRIAQTSSSCMKQKRLNMTSSRQTSFQPMLEPPGPPFHGTALGNASRRFTMISPRAGGDKPAFDPTARQFI